MTTVSIILSISAIICCIFELIHMIIQERKIRRTMKLRLNSVYGKLACNDTTELTPKELKYMRVDTKTSKKAYKAIKKAYKSGCSFVDATSVFLRRNQND